MKTWPLGLLVVAAALGPQPAQAQDAPPSDGSVQPAPKITLTTAEFFAFADRARDSGDYAAAETAYRALATNRDPEIRTEARFRLGMMLADMQQRYADAAVEFRRILDERPRAARIRLELARMNAMLGRSAAAARELRAAQATGLPPEVQKTVRFYAGALEANKPLGVNLAVALAPDSNINRSTRSGTLGTVIGDLTLDADAKARSGLGLALRGQAFARVPLAGNARLLTQLSTQASLYRTTAFNDIVVLAQSGPEIALGKDRLNLNATLGARWYGSDPYSRSYGVDASWLHPAGRRGQLRLGAGIVREDNRLNDLQDATVFSARANVDRALSPVLGGGVQAYGQRSAARDPGYATASGGGSLYLFRELGSLTAVADLGYAHLEADRRLFLFPRRRIDDRYSAGLSLTLRALSLGRIAPVVGARYERNVSTVELYDYRRFAGEIGITASF